jgi:hypothetical protein
LVKAVKLYPAGATTNSHGGVRDLSKVTAVLERMAEIGLPLCVHGEVTTHDVDIFDREAVFIDTVLDPLRRRIPGLRVVMEHITTEEGVAYARAGDDTLGATITTHHLILNRNHILVGGINRITTACQWPSAKSTALPCAPPQQAAKGGSFWAPTLPRMSMRSRKIPAVAPVASPPPTRCNFSPMCSRKRARLTGWRPSPA